MKTKSDIEKSSFLLDDLEFKKKIFKNPKSY